MRRAVKDLLRMGKYPTDANPEEYWLENERIFDSIEVPVTLEEAYALLDCFHDPENEDWHRGAQSLIHLIESCPDFEFKEQPDFKNEWHKYMRERQFRSPKRSTIRH